MKKHDRVPKKLHQALSLTLNDIKSFKDDPNVIIDMDCWFSNTEHSCKVCLAGSVLLGMQRERGYTDNKIEEILNDNHGRWDGTLMALNFIRLGKLRNAVMSMYPNTARREFEPAIYEVEKSIDILCYESVIRKGNELDAFISYLTKLQKILKTVDL